MTATDERLVLIELADGNFVVVPTALSRTFRGITDGQLIVDGPAERPRAFPDHLDGADYLAGLACTECGDIRDDLLVCETCNLQGCACLIARRAFDCGVLEDGQTLCDDCTPFHGGCPQCDPPGPHD